MTRPPGETFDTVAEAYDRTRPGYPAALLDRLEPPGDTLEVGCGTGQLTVDLLRSGHRVVAVDIGPQLLALARRRCPTATFVEGDFATTELGDRSFDLVVSATAFHWIDPRVGYEKASRHLRSAGRLALLSHRVVAGPGSERLDGVLHEHAPSLTLGALPTSAMLRARVTSAGTDDISSVLAAIEGRPDLRTAADRWFGPCEVASVEWEQGLSGPQLVESLVSTNMWPLLPAQEAEALSEGLLGLVRDLGGSFPRRRLTFLVMAERRSRR